MDVEDKVNLALRYPTEELLTVEELRNYFETGETLKHYIGFEISGYIHIGTGVVSMYKLVDLQKAGVKVSILLADLHSWLNHKLGGDLEVIKNVAVTYFKETLKKSISILGGDPDSVDFILASNLVEEKHEYWIQVLDLARQVSLSDVRHSLTIMGRTFTNTAKMSWLIYPLMQVIDVYALGTHIAHGGVDQRKVYVLAREVYDKIKLMPLTLEGRAVKPIILLHHLIPSLTMTGKESRLNLSEAKMSKSRPETAIFLHDSPDDVAKKIKNAYCPPKTIENNPVVELAKLFSFREPRKNPFTVKRPSEYGGAVEYWTFDELTKDYAEGKIHPLDLKSAVIEEAIRFLEPYWKWFSNGDGAKLLSDMSSMIKVTR
ncbi:tyrosine--tRNA ligase [Caldivirga sp. UBA161]|uniref:tyrosine--tRNA ligase n=1 Tax=Caldivirga sp. UBA161 TaxID=1915569 RepID=UPI0025B83E22|nr:tyrosine--tRNA ligase [Caldivirga sp. UBA161]